MAIFGVEQRTATTEHISTSIYEFDVSLLVGNTDRRHGLREAVYGLFEDLGFNRDNTRSRDFYDQPTEDGIDSALGHAVKKEPKENLSITLIRTPPGIHFGANLETGSSPFVADVLSRRFGARNFELAIHLPISELRNPRNGHEA